MKIEAVIKHFIIAFVTFSFVAACSNSRVVQPLNANQWQAAASFGGPVISSNKQKGITPLTSVSGAYGLSQSTTISSAFHISSYQNDVYHADIAITKEYLKPFAYQPGITLTTSANLMFGKTNNEFRLFPQIDLNSYWLLPFRNDFAYLGITNFFDINLEKAHGETQQTHWIPGLHAGYTVQLEKYGFNSEIKYLAPFKKNNNALVDYLSPTDTGALALYFSISRKF